MRQLRRSQREVVAQRRFRRELEKANDAKLLAEHRARLQIQMELERDAKKRRADRLAHASVTYAAERERTKHRAARRRQRIRQTARRAIGDARQARREEREWWRRFRRASKAQSRKRPPTRSRSEIDSLTEHNIPPEQVGYFRQVAKHIPYDRTPDERAELFAEMIHDDPQGWENYQLEQIAATDWAAAELAHYQDQLGQELAEVPF